MRGGVRARRGEAAAQGDACHVATGGREGDPAGTEPLRRQQYRLLCHEQQRHFAARHAGYRFVSCCSVP